MRSLTAALLLIFAGSVMATDPVPGKDALSRSRATEPGGMFEDVNQDLQDKRDIYDVAIQFYAAQIRARADFACYPPSQGAGDIRLTLWSLNHFTGAVVLDRMTRNPSTLPRVIARMEAWDPGVVADYQPGWRHDKSCPDYPTAAQDSKQKTLKYLHELSELLAIPDYRAAFDYRVAYYNKQSLPPELVDKFKDVQAAESAITSIEQQKGVDVLSTDMHRMFVGYP